MIAIYEIHYSFFGDGAKIFFPYVNGALIKTFNLTRSF